jgi:hypothetical protein
MPRVQWALRHGRPCLEVVLTLAADGQPVTRIFLADQAQVLEAGVSNSSWTKDDCLLCGGNPLQPVKLGGAYTGSFPTYAVSVRLPALGFDQILRAVGVPSPPAPFDGIACFGFLNRFTHGNFGDHACPKTAFRNSIHT